MNLITNHKEKKQTQLTLWWRRSMKSCVNSDSILSCEEFPFEPSFYDTVLLYLAHDHDLFFSFSNFTPPLFSFSLSLSYWLLPTLVTLFLWESAVEQGRPRQCVDSTHDVTTGTNVSKLLQLVGGIVVGLPVCEVEQSWEQFVVGRSQWSKVISIGKIYVIAFLTTHTIIQLYLC